MLFRACCIGSPLLYISLKENSCYMSLDWNRFYFETVLFWKLWPDLCFNLADFTLLSCVRVNGLLWSPLSDAVLYHVSISKHIKSDAVTRAALHMTRTWKQLEKSAFVGHFITQCAVAFVKLVRVRMCREILLTSDWCLCGKEQSPSKYSLSPHFVQCCISGFSCISKWQGLFTGIDDLAGACQKLLLFEEKIHSVRITVSQESLFLMVKYKSLIAVCGFTTKLSLFVSVSAGSHAVSTASVGLGASHQVPQKNKWVSCLSIVRYWVSGLECGQCAKVAGRGECSLVFLTWWDGVGGGLEDSSQTVLHRSVLLLMSSTNTYDFYQAHTTNAPSHMLLSFRQDPNIECCPLQRRCLSKAARAEVEEQW